MGPPTKAHPNTAAVFFFGVDQVGGTDPHAGRSITLARGRRRARLYLPGRVAGRWTKTAPRGKLDGTGEQVADGAAPGACTEASAIPGSEIDVPAPPRL
jgi:hypothetical protein